MVNDTQDRLRFCFFRYIIRSKEMPSAADTCLMNIYDYALKRDDLIARFWGKVIKASSEDCWLWTGRRAQNYGEALIRVDGKTHYMSAHRFSYAMAYGSY